MWAWRHATLSQQFFEFGNHRLPEYVLDQVCIAVDVNRRDIGMRDQVGLPEAMIAHHASRLLKTIFGQLHGPAGAATNETFTPGIPQNGVQAALFP